MSDTVQKLANSIENAITGVPAPVRKNLIKAIGQLCSAVVDIPTAWLEGKSADIRATTDARVNIIRNQGEKISEQIQVPDEYLRRAAHKFAAKIMKEQVNLDQITINAVHELTANKKTEESDKEVEEISEDWLNEFEYLARLKSSQDLKVIFGKILAGEIVRPGRFSIKTMKLVAQLDNEAAKLFQMLCSQAVSQRIGDYILDARVVAFSGSAALNSLQNYGLSFSALNILQEYGFIISDYNSYMTYSTCIANKKMKISAVLRFQNKDYGLVPSDWEKYDSTLKLDGVALTKAGRELLDIIPLAPAENYKQALIEFLQSKHLRLEEVR